VPETHLPGCVIAQVAGLGFAGYVIGLALSVATELPSSAVIAWTMAILGLIVHLCGNGRHAPARQG